MECLFNIFTVKLFFSEENNIFGLNVLTPNINSKITAKQSSILILNQSSK